MTKIYGFNGGIERTGLKLSSKSINQDGWLDGHPLSESSAASVGRNEPCLIAMLAEHSHLQIIAQVLAVRYQFWQHQVQLSSDDWVFNLPYFDLM